MRFVIEVAECLSNRLTSQVAAGLSRSLLLLSTTSTAGPAEAHLSAQLLPRLIAFVILPCDVEGTDETRASVAHTLTTFVAALDEARSRAAAMGMVIPAIVLRAKREGERVWKDSRERFIELADRDGVMFRALVGARLNEDDTNLLKEIVRSGEESDEDEDEEDGDLGGGKRMTEGGQGPSIELKTEF